MGEDRKLPDNCEQTDIENQLQYAVEGVRDPLAARAIILLSQGATYGEVAAKLRIGRTKLWELRRDHNIDNLVAELAMDIVDASYRRNLAVVREAVDTLVQIMRDEDNKPSERMAAAKELLTQQRQDARIAAYARARGVDLDDVSTGDLLGIVESADSGGGEG